MSPISLIKMLLSKVGEKMNYYIGAIPYSSELYHHGIKGQKWGVRRYQNKDGSRTKAGMSRYKKGREVRRELNSLRDQEHDRLRKASKKYKETEKEVERLKSRMDYEWDDYERKRIDDRRWNKEEDLRALDEEFNKKASEYAAKQVLEKRGKEAISDLQYYENINTAAVTTAAILAAFGMVAITSRRH